MAKKRGKHRSRGGCKIRDESMSENVVKQMTPNVEEANDKKANVKRRTEGQESHKENLESQEQDGKAAKIKMKRKKKVALEELRCRVEDAILGNYLLGKPNKNLSPKESAKAIEQLKEITLWGVPLLPSKGHEGTDIVLLKFLKAKRYKVREAFEMLRKTLKWRREYKADDILEENLGPDFEKVVYLDSKDKDGHPLFYNVFGALKEKETFEKTFGTEKNFEKFLRWRVQYIEKGIKELNFKAGGADSILEITDLKNKPASDVKELQILSKKALTLLQDNYPELIYKNIIINVPFWYYLSHLISSRLKMKSPKATRKFVFARPSKVTETLLKFVAPENLPVEYGGLKRENDEEFSPEEKASELIVKGNAASSIDIPVQEPGVTVVWDLTVVGWDVSYKEEFVPDDEGSYNVLLQNEKEKKTRESVRNSFYISEPGKIVITFENGTLKKKTALYRYKTKPTVPMYILFKK